MKVSSLLYDQRIKATNVLFVMTIGQYLDLTRDCIDKNPYQRKRVASSKSVYALLRDDIVKGCVIPPIVLALTKDVDDKVIGEPQALQLVSDNPGSLLILDGLQRTYTLSDIEQSLAAEAKEDFRAKNLRVEVYLGLNKIGILYRMLTLNTGQTPMSLRQQIEMLYSDYIDVGLDGVTFVREVDEAHATAEHELNFRETIEGFNSYLERDELPLDRSDLLENIKSLESLSHENASSDLFKDYVLAWQAFYKKAIALCGSAEFTPEKESAENLAPWGKTAAQVFRKPQVMTGFGAALGKLKDREKLENLGAVLAVCDDLKLSILDPLAFIEKVNSNMSWINKNTKKIGNAQRMLFQFYFRDLFNKESDTYLALDSSLESAMHKLQSQLF
jgi:hypothetical protein